MALTKAMAEAAGDAGWCVHLGATSNDIVDTAVGLQFATASSSCERRWRPHRGMRTSPNANATP
ncbi:MAG: hypothetical protein CM15mP18_4890 [Methanobacteriota archaeon]|nr:MAG: hypothetical protein CM15mP18_4890 [Euryarchaeota archaeon]